MTAEIVIMNKSAVALAADSAVTLSIGNGRKIYNSANKLFMLSNIAPVGVMIYGNSSLNGTPWETIIKTYRDQFRNARFSSLAEYSSNFIEYINGAQELFSGESQSSVAQTRVYAFFGMIKDEIDQTVNQALSRNQLTINALRNITSKIISKYWSHLSSRPNLSSSDTAFSISIQKALKNVSLTAQTDVFNNLPITRTSKTLLSNIAHALFIKDFPSPWRSGVVIAGFGTNEAYPSLIAYSAEAYVQNKLIYNIDKKVRIDDNSSAWIIPFAQREMVDTFMQGVDYQLLSSINRYQEEMFEDHKRMISKKLKGLISETILTGIQDDLFKASKELRQKFDERIKKYMQKNHVQPVISAVGSLPKDELAAMAESLVSITSLKRKYSTQEETVGGPIDVAVISKGDGFVWIRRKHYFKPELNPQYFARYLRVLESTEED